MGWERSGFLHSPCDSNGDLIGGSNANNRTAENRELGNNLHRTGQVAGKTAEIAKDEAPGVLIVGIAPQIGVTRWIAKFFGKAGGAAATAEVAGVRGSSRALYSSGEVRGIAKDLGLKQVGKSGDLPIFLNKGEGAKYLVPSRTSHSGDVFKGFKTLKEAEAGKPGKSFREGSYDKFLNRTGD